MGASLACAIQPGENIFEILDRLSQILRQPFSLHYTVYTGKCILILSFAYITGICIYYSQQKNYRRGVEHGSARWGDVHQICKRYADKEYTHNLLLTQNFRMSQEVYKHQRNLNVLVAGGSGAGKSRTYAVPNILQCSQAESKKGGGCSIVVTDPKGELLRKTGGLLERMGYEVRVFDLINPDTSFCYNPFCYVHDDKDVLKLINNLIRNTTPKGSQASDPFWEKSETALLQALMLYLLHEAPPEEQNFPMIMEMLGSAQVKEEDEEYQSPLDILFERLEMRKPDSIAVKQYQIYKQAAGKTAKSILISVGVRLAAFNLKEIANLKRVIEDVGNIYERRHLLQLFLNNDFPSTPRYQFKFYSDATIKRLNSHIFNMDEQIARALIVHQLLGTRISDTLTLRMDCLREKEGRYFVRIDQVKSITYEKAVSNEVGRLILKAMEYTKERYGETEYVFVKKDDPTKPYQYGMIQAQVMRMIRQKDIRDDNGELLKFGTHIFRHCYGKKLTELHIEDWMIARLLGHKTLQSVHHYRRIGNKVMADETRKTREKMDLILMDIIKGWDGYEL